MWLSEEMSLIPSAAIESVSAGCVVMSTSCVKSRFSDCLGRSLGSTSSAGLTSFTVATIFGAIPDARSSETGFFLQ
jgi:hypothetical protein